MAIADQRGEGRPEKGVGASNPGQTQRQSGGWLARIAPGVRALTAKRETTPENLWVKCPDTGEMIYRPDLEAALWVTPSGVHMRVTPTQRFSYTFDNGVWEELPVPLTPDDPFGFSDTKPYAERLVAMRKATGDRDAMRIAVGEIAGEKTVVLVQNAAFIGGSLGTAAGEAFIAACDAALERGLPMICFTASGGARMQEGPLSLMQMARTTLAIQRLKAAHLPYIVVMTDPTMGGVTASYAMLGDIHLAEPGALIGFAGPRVIEQTIRETLPPGFQRAEYLVEKGMVDRVVHRRDLPAILGSVMGVLTSGRKLAA